MDNNQNNEYSSEYSAQSNKKQDKQSWKKAWWIAGLLLLLILLTTIILLCRSCAFVSIERNSIFLVPPNPGFHVYDADQSWGTENHIDLFEEEYLGNGKDITVRSENGDKLIAPGTESEYTFNLKNTGNVAMDYSVSIHTRLDIADKEIDLKSFPIGVRLRTYSGEYLLGDGKHWEPIYRLDDYVADGTLAVNNYAWYTLEWKWLYDEYIIDENGTYVGPVNDFLDTLLGNMSADAPVSLCISISTVATPSEDFEAVGGVQQDFSGDTLPFSYSQIGGRIRLWPILLILILIILLVIIGIILHINHKDKSADDDCDSANDLHSNETTESQNEESENNEK